MNERIRELFEQAGLRHYGEDYFAKTDKFAELLLDNVLSVVEQAKNDPFVSLDDAKRMTHFVDVTKKRIEKHFRS
jgi:hypothetical protein